MRPCVGRYVIGGRKAGSRLTSNGARSVRDVGVGPNATSLLNVSEMVMDSGEPCTARHVHLPRHGVGHSPGGQSPSSQHAATDRCCGRDVVALAGVTCADSSQTVATFAFDRSESLAGRVPIDPLAPASAMANQSTIAAPGRRNAVDLDGRRCTG